MPLERGGVLRIIADMSQPTASPPPPSVLTLGLHWFTQRAGGLDRYVAGLTTHRPADAATRVLALRATDDDRELPDIVRFYARATDSPAQRRRRLRAAVDEAFAERHYDVVASHFAQVAHPVRGRRGRADVPHVVHFHGPWAAESRREGAGRLSVLAKAWIERGVYRQADRIICLSRAFADLLIQTYRIDPARVVAIPGGVDTRAFDPPLDRRAARERLGWHADRPTVVCVRRLVHRMGLESLIDATAELRRSMPDLSVKICGKGPLAEPLDQRIRAAGLEGNVTLVGFVPDDLLPLVYRAADLSIVPTESLEGFGLTTLESLAAGTPCLVTPVGGLPEAVSGISERLVLGGIGTAAVREGLRLALRTAGSASLPSAAECQTYARQRFDWTTIARRVWTAYGQTKTT